MSDDEYGTDIELTEELDHALQAAESQLAIPITLDSDVDLELEMDKVKSESTTPEVDVMDIEDLVQPSPFEEFKNGYLSVTDLVGTVWCEVQVSTSANVFGYRVKADSGQYD